jgi:hypothetical protein
MDKNIQAKQYAYRNRATVLQKISHVHPLGVSETGPKDYSGYNGQYGVRAQRA